MRQLIAITDVTQMEGDQVCIAGVTPGLECVRPVTEGGVRIWTLYKAKKPIIYPGSKVWFDLCPTEVVPPHIEDRTFDPLHVEHKDDFISSHWESLLRQISCGSVDEVFDGNLENRRVLPGTRTRSLGTLRNVEVLNLSIDDRYHRQTVRMDFKDEAGGVYTRFPINDLAFRGFYEKGRSKVGGNRAVNEILDRIRSAAHVYLRIGLARPTEIGDYDEACWAQITGVYTFPDYLNGRTWANFQ